MTMVTMYYSGLLLQMCIPYYRHLSVPIIFLRIIFQMKCLPWVKLGGGGGGRGELCDAAPATAKDTVQPYY